MVLRSGIFNFTATVADFMYTCIVLHEIDELSTVYQSAGIIIIYNIYVHTYIYNTCIYIIQLFKVSL